MDDSRRDKSGSEFADIGRDMFLAGLVGSHSGNMSVRLDDRVVITRRGARLGRLSADDLVEFRLFHDEIPYEASTESSVHLAVYAISDHVAVIHAHPIGAIAASLIERGAAFVPQTLEAAHYIPRVPVVDAPAGKAVEGMSEEVAQMLTENNVVIARRHGTYSAGTSLENAFQWTSVLEDACKVTLALGYAGSGISPTP